MLSRPLPFYLVVQDFCMLIDDSMTKEFEGTGYLMTWKEAHVEENYFDHGLQ